MKKATIIKYCTGCGACVSSGEATLEMNPKGFPVAKPKKDSFNLFCNRICFSSGFQYRGGKPESIWGGIVSSSYAWSTVPEIRRIASSGGTLTALCLYLLDSGKVDGIVHVQENPDNPIDTITTCSMTRDEIINHCGSRYSSSSPLLNIFDYLQTEKKYCFVGKPCDVATMRNLMKTDHRFEESFIILLSFFCAGAPSVNANLLLLNKLNTTKEKCISLRYRGDGWPGYATAIDINGEKHTMDYRSAWRDTLGRDIRPICRFCLDGIGEHADVVCFDAWYMDDKKNPMFTEADGRNGVFCRTAIGQVIFEEAVNNGYIIVEKSPQLIDNLSYIQRYQFTRRVTMCSTILAMRVLLKSVPSYPLKYIWHFMKYDKFRSHFSRFRGTIIRVIQGKI